MVLHTTPNLEKCSVIIAHSEQHHSHSPIQLLRLHTTAIIGDPTHLVDILLLPKLSEISISIYSLRDTQWTATSPIRY